MISTRIDMVTWQWQDDRPMGMALGVLSAIFATQWLNYQKRLDAAAGQLRWPTWLRRLLE